MTTQFDSFDQSPLGAFVESPLGARNRSFAGFFAIATVYGNIGVYSTQKNKGVLDYYPPAWVELTEAEADAARDRYAADLMYLNVRRQQGGGPQAVYAAIGGMSYFGNGTTSATPGVKGWHPYRPSIKHAVFPDGVGPPAGLQYDESLPPGRVASEPLPSLNAIAEPNAHEVLPAALRIIGDIAPDYVAIRNVIAPLGVMLHVSKTSPCT